MWPVEGAPCLLDSHSQGDADGDGSSDDVLSIYNMAGATPGFMLVMSVEPRPHQDQDHYPKVTTEEPALQGQQMAESGFKPELGPQNLSGDDSTAWQVREVLGTVWVQVPAPPFLCCVTWGTFPNLSKSQFFICEMGITATPTYQCAKRNTVDMLRAQVPAQSTCSINVSGCCCCDYCL